MMPLAASDGMGWVNITVKGKQTVKIGRRKDPVTTAHMHVMITFPAGIINGALKQAMSTVNDMTRAAIR